MLYIDIVIYLYQSEKHSKHLNYITQEDKTMTSRDPEIKLLNKNGTGIVQVTKYINGLKYRVDRNLTANEMARLQQAMTTNDIYAINDEVERFI